MSDVKRYLEHERPNLLFVHLAEPDLLGHVFGWMSPTYGAGVRKVDQEVGKLLVAADRAFGAGNYTVLLTADHGGHGRDHGSADPRDVTIPWVAWGKGIEAGVVLEPGVRTMDTAATALWLLGVPPSDVSVGHAVTAALVPAASALVDSGRADSAAAEVLASPGG
jgi:arylsulfatase A-like enzyme